MRFGPKGTSGATDVFWRGGDDRGAAIELEQASSSLAEIVEDNGEDGAFGEMEKVNKATVNARVKEIKKDPEADEELVILRDWLELNNQEAATKKALKTAEAELDGLAYIRYKPDKKRGGRTGCQMQVAKHP